MNFTTIIIVSLGLLILWLTVVKPRAALFLFVFTLMAFNDYLGGLPDSIMKIGGHLFWAADLFIFLLVIGVIRNIQRQDSYSRVDKTIFIMMLVNAGMGVVAILVGIDNGHEFNAIIGDFRRYCYYPFAIFIPAIYLKSVNDLRILERLVFGAASVICAIAAYRIITGSSYFPEQHGAEWGYFRAMSYPDYHILIFAICIAIGKVVDVKERCGLLPKVFLVVLPIFVIASNYRMAGLLMVVSSIMVLLILRRTRMSLQPIIKAASLGIALIAAVIFVGAITENKAFLEVQNKIEERVVHFDWQGQESYRTEMWKEIIEQWSVSPLLGVGFGRTFSYEAQTPDGYWYWVEADDFHNTYLGLLLKEGIIGVIIFLTVYLVMIERCVRILRIYQEERALVAAGITFIISVLVEAAVQPILSVPNSIVVFYLIIGSITSMCFICTSADRSVAGL